MALPKKKISSAAPPTEEASGVRQVDEAPAEAIGSRLARQNKGVERFLKGADENAQREFDPPNRKLPKVRIEGKSHEGAEFNPSEREADSHMAGRILRGDPEFTRLEPYHLWRAYKFTPHQPAAVFMKYLVHRINNIDNYDDPADALRLDSAFLEHHKKGKASEKNGHLVPADLHGWMKKHPSVPEELLLHKAKLHAELNRGVGLNIRTIAGQPYVALTRGLNSDIMDHEHALSSWSDLADSGFGSNMHHAWVPLKDLWYSYQHGPKAAGGDAGHENEYLVAHTTPRFEAESHDVKQVRGHRSPLWYDSATDDELAGYVAKAEDIGEVSALKILQHSGAGPKTLDAITQAGGKPWTRVPHLNEGHLLQTKFRTREQALASNLPSSVQNPNLTTEDLSQKILAMSATSPLSLRVGSILGHPQATSDTARTLASQYVPGDARTEHFIHELAKSPLSPPDVLEKVVAGFEQTPSGIERNAGPMGQLGTVALRNPNITSEQADRIGRASLEVPNIDSNRFTSGPFSAQFINELSDEVARGFGKEPLDTDTKYKGGRLDEKFHSDLDRFLSTKARFYGVYGVLAQMGANRNLGDDAVEALTEAAERHGIFEVLPYLAHRQNAAPMSEISQLRTLRALDSVPHPNEGFSAVPILAQAKGLAPSTVAALALHPNQDVRETLYRNKTVDPEVLAKAWPKKNQTPEEYLAHATEVGPGPKGQWQNDPYHDLARAIRDRRAYAARKAAQHLIKPWPKPLAKSETDWWPVKLREWMSQRSKDEEHQGYFFRAKNLDQARRLVQDKVIPTEPTDEILDGQAVFAHPAKDYHYHAWEKDRDAGDVLVYFETDSPPTHYDDRVYWPHDVVAGDVRVAGIRPANLQKMATVYGKSGPLRADMYPGLSPEQKWKGPAVSVNEEPDSAQVQYLKRATEVVHKLSPELHKECGGIADVVRRIGALGGVKAAMDAGAAAWPHGDKEDQGEHVWLRVGKELFDPKAHLLSLKHPKMFAKKPPYHNYRPYRPASWAKDLYDDLANVGDDPDELAAKAFHEVGPFGLSKGEQPLVKMAVLHDDPVKPRIVYRIEDDWGRGPYAAEGIGTGKVTPKRPVPTKDWQGTDEWHNHPSDVNFGFVKPEDAVEWFSAGTLGKLRQKGFKLRAVPAKKVWVSNSGRQVFFEPHESYQPGKAEIIQPKGAINWKPFQKRDLDPSLGYTISSKPHPSGLEVLAHDRNGVQVGRSLIGLSLRHGGNIPHLTYVEPEHQRKGIASAMYQHFENTTGEKVLPSDMQSEEAEKLWAQPGRKFGKSESLSRGPAFNGEKDYRPDESGDPKFPFQGGPRKEQTELSALTLPGSDLEPGEHRTALAQLGHNDRFELVLAAACFLARKRFDADKFQQGLAVYGDEVRAALHAVDLGDSEKNMRALAAVVQLQGGKARALSKSEGSQPIGIHSVQPGNERAVDFAEAVERAVRAGNVVHLKLSGKHSRGAMACRDPHSGKVFLLKPPGGKQSPAAGARDGSVSQPRREACFWHVADKVHLGGVIPHAELIIVNAQEWSAISLLGSDWKSLDEKNREKQYKGREVLTPYLSAGQIHRWALLDGILGNTDSHGQNLLVNEGGSVALIDHGAALAGPKFDPAHDTKSFIPFYLRVFAPDSDFKKKSPEERIKHMPRLGKYEDDILKKWLVEDFTPEMTEREMRVYGVDDTIIKAVWGRLQALRSVSGNLSEAVNRRWAGLESW